MKTQTLLIFACTASLSCGALAQPVEQSHPTPVNRTARPRAAPAPSALLAANYASAVIAVEPESVKKVEELAASGDAAAEKTLAEWLCTGQVVEKDVAQAYKWALLAVSAGNTDAKYLVREFELFMRSEDRQKGKGLAEEYMAAQKKKTEKAKSELDKKNK